MKRWEMWAGAGIVVGIVGLGIGIYGTGQADRHEAAQDRRHVEAMAAEERRAATADRDRRLYAEAQDKRHVEAMAAIRAHNEENLRALEAIIKALTPARTRAAGPNPPPDDGRRPIAANAAE